MRKQTVLSLAIAAEVLQAGGCSYIAGDCAGSQANAQTAIGCERISCSDASCGVLYTAIRKMPSWSTSAYFAFGAVVVTASLVVYSSLWVVTHDQIVFDTDAVEKPPNTAAKPSLVVRGYRFAHGKVFGSLLTADRKRTRRLTEYWVSECQLLDSFWCSSQRERPRRRLSLRLMRLVSSLLVTASISFFFGTLELDKAVYSKSLAESDNNNSAGNSTPPLIGSMSKVSSVVAFSVTQCVKFIGSYAQNLGRPDSTFDWCAHFLWLVIAAAAIPTSASLSTRLLSDGAATYRSEEVRLRLILSVALSAWLQVQIAHIFQVPVIYWSKMVGHTMLPNPDDVASKAMQPRLRDLDCLGGQHKAELLGKDEGEPTKGHMLTPLRATRCGSDTLKRREQ